MPFTFELCLEERHADRVFATVHLAPDHPDAILDGVALQLFDRDGECLSPKLLLPVSGHLVGPLSTRAELRTSGRPIPEGAEVVATAWWPDGQIQIRRSTDRGTDLEAHVRATPAAMPADDDLLLELLPEDRERLIAVFPWLAKPRPRKVLPLDAEPSAEDLADDYGLADDDAEWLKGLVDDD